MEKLQREMKEQGLEVVAINIKESRKAVRKFTGELGLSFTVLLDKDAKVSEEYGAWGIPLSYFMNRKGEVVGKGGGQGFFFLRCGGKKIRARAARASYEGITKD